MQNQRKINACKMKSNEMKGKLLGLPPKKHLFNVTSLMLDYIAYEARGWRLYSSLARLLNSHVLSSLPSSRIIAFACSLGFNFILPGRLPCCLPKIKLASWPICSPGYELRPLDSLGMSP